MEGISDGMAVDDCYYCALLYPGLAACPRCANRFHYRSAQIRDISAQERDFEAAIAGYRQNPSVDGAVNLLILWHELGDEAAPIAKANDLEPRDLRHHFSVPPKSNTPASK